jgi:hypothetical protein
VKFAPEDQKLFNEVLATARLHVNASGAQTK